MFDRPGEIPTQLPFPSDFLTKTQVLLNSYRRWLGEELIGRSADQRAEAWQLFQAPFVVVAHDTSDNPMLNYGNQAALDLWEMDLTILLATPSCRTAEPVHREARNRLLERTRTDGYVDDYQGIRISATGKRFQIRQAVVWNLLDPQGRHCGQAATFHDWVLVRT